MRGQEKFSIAPEIQNELLKIDGKEVLRSFVKRVQDSSYYALIIDEASDILGEEHVSFILRYVLPENFVIWKRIQALHFIVQDKI